MKNKIDFERMAKVIQDWAISIAERDRERAAERLRNFKSEEFLKNIQNTLKESNK